MGEDGFHDKVARKVARKLKMQRDGPQGVWFGLGMSGLIGWSVAVPTLAGALFGVWLDRYHPGSHWLAQQDKTMNDESEGNDE
jgi:ATP synthase protein I